MDTKTTYYVAPQDGSLVKVKINAALIQGLRAHHEDAPSVTNHQLADRVQAVLDSGQDYIEGICTKTRGFAGFDGNHRVRLLRGEELVWLRCPQLTDDPREQVVFCAQDCHLKTVLT